MGTLSEQGKVGRVGQCIDRRTETVWMLLHLGGQTGGFLTISYVCSNLRCLQGTPFEVRNEQDSYQDVEASTAEVA